MSLITLPAFLTRHREDTPMPGVTEAPAPIDQAESPALMRFLTQGEAVVELRRHAWTATYYRDGKVYRREDKRGFEWHCGGCDMTGAAQNLRLAGHGYDEHEPRESRRDANEHATNCQAMPKPTA